MQSLAAPPARKLAAAAAAAAPSGNQRDLGPLPALLLALETAPAIMAAHQCFAGSVAELRPMPAVQGAAMASGGDTLVPRLAAFISDFIAQLTSHRVGSLAQVRRRAGSQSSGLSRHAMAGCPCAGAHASP